LPTYNNYHFWHCTGPPVLCRWQHRLCMITITIYDLLVQFVSFDEITTVDLKYMRWISAECSKWRWCLWKYWKPLTVESPTQLFYSNLLQRAKNPRAVICCLRLCICPTSVINVFHTGIPIASKKAQWTKEQMKVSMSAVEKYCIIVCEWKNAVKFLIYLYEIFNWNF